MSRPRICDILDVEVNERFKVGNDYYQADDFYIDEDGELWYENGYVGGHIGGVLTYIIEHPENIIHKFQWTEKDKSDARAMKQLWDDAAIVKCGAGYISIWTKRHNDGSCGDIIADFPNKDHRLFPSLRTVNKEVSFDEILGDDTDQ